MAIKETNQEIHERFMQEFRLIYSAQMDGRVQCIEDRRFVFVNGGMWEGSLYDQFENRPRFEINKVLMGLKRIESEYRNNRIQINFRPDRGSDENDEEMAEVLEGLLRANEQESNAGEAYDNAFKEGTAGGIGAWRLRVDYYDELNDEDEDDKCIKIEPIFDADQSVYWDLDSKRYDKKDAKLCFVIHSMTPESYRKKYEHDPASFAAINRTIIFDWFQSKVVYVAEVYEITKESVEVVEYRSMITGEEMYHDAEELDEQMIDDMKARGFEYFETRKVKRKKCMKYIIDGAQILEEPIEIPGGQIPIVMFYGNRDFIDNIERTSGYVRPTKDAQRLYNMQVSMLAETAAYSPIQKPIVDPEQIRGLEQFWAEDNIKRYPFLPLKALRNASGEVVANGVASYTQAPNLPPALQGIIQLMDADLKEVTGSAEQAEKMVSNVSADAISLIQNQVGMVSFVYIDNMAKSMQRSAEIWHGMAKEVYKAGEYRVVGQDGSDSNAELMYEGVNEQDGTLKLFNDVTKGKYKVIADVGPSFASKRDQTVKSLVNLLGVVTIQSPYAPAIMGMIFANMDGEGMEDVKKYARQQMLQQGIVEPANDEEKAYLQQLQQQAQSAPPDAQTQYLQAAAAEASSKAEQAQANTVKTAADAEKTKAETAKILAELDQTAMDRVIQLVNAIREGETHQMNQAQMQQQMELNSQNQSQPASE